MIGGTSVMQFRFLDPTTALHNMVSPSCTTGSAHTSMFRPLLRGDEAETLSQ